MTRHDKLIQEFLTHLRSKGYSERTITDYGYSLGYFASYMKERRIRKLSDVTTGILRSYQDYIHHDYRPIRGKALSLGYQANLLKALKGLFRYLARNGHILSDPSSSLSMPKLPQRIPKNILTPSEMRKILSSPDISCAEGFRDRCILEVLYSTGIRKSELSGLKVYDVDTASREVRVHGKGGKDRVVPLTHKAAQVIERYLREHRPELIGHDGRDSGQLFLNDRGRKLGKHWATWLVRKYAKLAGIKKNITTHTFRHTFATHLLKNRVSIRVIQELLGHSSLNSTQIYTKVDLADLKRAIDRNHPREKML